MAIQRAKMSIENIDDANGTQSVVTALKNITGVKAVEIDAVNNAVIVSYDDKDTSIHAFTAAISTVDYVTQPFPIDAPQNPRNMD